MKLYKEPIKALNEMFKCMKFRSMQEEIIQDLINKKDCLVIMPTGAGKSICYQVPALCMHGCAIIISPLISLMQEQVRYLKNNGIRASSINYMCSNKDYSETIKDLLNQAIDILYVSPEKLFTNSMLQILRKIQISFFAIDEVHCVSQWGHDFRPEYLKLSQIRSFFKDIPISGFTATADPQTIRDIEQKLCFDKVSQNFKKFISSFKRDNIKISFIKKTNEKNQLLKYCKEYKGQSVIIYARSRKKVDEIYYILSSERFNTTKYHAGMTPEQRKEEQSKFIKTNTIMVATIAFGMGINKPNVRLVLHVDIPSSIESYYQEIGRAGRDGHLSNAILIYNESDIGVKKKIIYSSEKEEKKIHHDLKKFAMMTNIIYSQECRLKLILGYFGETTNSNYKCDHCDNCNNVGIFKKIKGVLKDNIIG